MNFAHPLIDKIAKRLCYASAIGNECPFCINEICQPKMWTSFRKEAESVFNLLKEEKIIVEKKKLPGLGG